MGKIRNKQKHNFIKSLAIIFAVLFIISGLRAIYTDSTNASLKHKISFSELVNEVNQEKVKDIVIENNDLHITLQNGELQKSFKEPGISLIESLTNYGIVPEKLNKINIQVKQASGWEIWASALMPILLPIIFIGILIWIMMRGAKKANFQAMNFGRSIARMIKPEKGKKNGVRFKDVAGLEEAKEELKEVVQFLKNPKKFTDLGAEIPRGVLLIGPPGCGKTLMARAVANEANVPFFNVSGSEFLELFVGVGSSRVRSLFSDAKKHKPCIIFIDELDAIGRKRGPGFGGSHEEREQTLNQILVEMDGFDKNEQVVVIAATNRPDTLDPALLRPGRFDRRITLNLPDIREREAILKIHAKGKPFDNQTNLKNIAERTPGFSGADLANLINESAILSARKNKKKIGMPELRDSIEKVLLGPEKKSRIITKTEKKIRAYHEAGHALIAHMIPKCDPVQKVSIIARGQAGGYTLKMPIHDKSIYSKSELKAELAVLLGGYLSESIIFNDLTTGASNDLQKATRLAKKMVVEYGMSKELGPVQYYDVNEQQITEDYFGYQIPTQRNFSEKTANKIDKAVRKLISEAKNNAIEILTQHKDKLDILAKKLIEQETIEKEEFEKLMDTQNSSTNKPVT